MEGAGCSHAAQQDRGPERNPYILENYAAVVNTGSVV